MIRDDASEAGDDASKPFNGKFFEKVRKVVVRVFDANQQLMAKNAEFLRQAHKAR